MKTTLQIIMVLFLGVVVSNCGGPSQAGPGAHAEQIGGPPGFVCFAIVSGSTVVGGNCLYR